MVALQSLLKNRFVKNRNLSYILDLLHHVTCDNGLQNENPTGIVVIFGNIYYYA